MLAVLNPTGRGYTLTVLLVQLLYAPSSLPDPSHGISSCYLPYS